MLLGGLKVVGLLLAAWQMLAQDAVFSQEGPGYWTNTASGSVPVAPHGRLIVVARAANRAVLPVNILNLIQPRAPAPAELGAFTFL